MTVAVLVISDGREDYLAQTLDSLEERLPRPDVFIHIDDSRHELGFAGAIQEGWRAALAADADYLLHVEQDFTFNRDVPVDAMIAALEQHPHLVQMALLRQPWNAHERAAGGIVQQHPDSYARCDSDDGCWLEHARFFTTNVSVIPRWVLERGWPQCPQSEGMFGLKLFAEDATRRSAFWGAGEEWITHIGEQRTGGGY